MYSLPITTYTDYWRTTKLWSTYVGGALALWAGTSWAGRRSEPFMATMVIPASLRATETIRVGEHLSIPDVPYRLQEKDGQMPVALRPQVMTEYRLQEVPIPVEVRESSQVPPGMKKVVEEGSIGLKRQVIKVVTVQGDIQEQVVHEFELNAPKKRIMIQNSKPVAGEPLDLTRLNVARIFTVEATAYTYTGNRTATGVQPRKGLIAVDPSVIPLGSRVYVDGYGYATAADTGGAILGNKVDVFFPSLRECLDWGRRPVRLYLLANSR
ncbi:MAG: 3D domain-containing protein [Desulfitobacteriaceae bacterium]|nr:3D domain-containing protein [Desulfitobacteriaceae bacterium]MDI6879297.1 3D domain-containing protein [Desulfitobacteriaceae bacterium]MDI6915249.1 3D domain-containing protein [Desulfitobacteriaceae bacterium]